MDATKTLLFKCFQGVGQDVWGPTATDSSKTQSVTWLAPTQVEFEATGYVRFALIEAGGQ